MLARCPVRRIRIGGPRRGLIVDDAYRAWIRRQACVCCGSRRYIECAHVGIRGLGVKSSDFETLPLCSSHHVQGPESHHALGRKFFEYWNLDRYALIAALNKRYMDRPETDRKAGSK